jgi:hypothetical protein
VSITGDTADRTGIYYFSLNVAFTGGNTLSITTVDEGWVAEKSSMASACKYCTWRGST